jgi:nucleoside-diphosphate-sugar epimerase|tara:strand:+ start:2957 stop:3805 length:849 start_codon:yes stop_codon:yes gene_type:complete
MNILVTGANGFLAKELINYFSESELKCNIIATDRKTLDPSNRDNVDDFFNDIEVDIVIHTAVRGGKRTHKESIDDLYENLSMFNNLSAHSDKYKMMFNFGSGAEFDRRYNIFRFAEENVNVVFPQDLYGLAKNLITRKIIDLNSNIFNFRLFGCFGPLEEDQRLFKATYNKILDNECPVIFQDREMDFFYSQDVGRVIEYYITNYNAALPKDLNLCYSDKHNISDLVSMLKTLTKAPTGVIIETTGLATSYSGSNSKLNNLNIKLEGLEKGLQTCLKNWNKS